jgi:hypothetical protein
VSASRDDKHWGNKFQDMLQSCQVELKKTTQIGMKMLSASQSNSLLKEQYEKLGMLTMQSMTNGELDWSNETAKELVERIEKLKVELSALEDQVSSLKKED